MDDFKITDPAEQAVTPGPAPAPGEWVRTVMKDRGLTMVAAAEKLGVDRAGLTLTLQGRYALSHDLAYKLEALLGVDAWALILAQARYEFERDQAAKRAKFGAEIERVEASADDAEAKRTRGKLLKKAG